MICQACGMSILLPDFKHAPNCPNARQVAGDHYKNPIQHWDWAASNDLDYFQGQITKYVARWKKKNGLDDLRKAQHFLERYILHVESNKEPEGSFEKDCLAVRQRIMVESLPELTKPAKPRRKRRAAPRTSKPRMHRKGR